MGAVSGKYFGCVEFILMRLTTSCALIVLALNVQLLGAKLPESAE